VTAAAVLAVTRDGTSPATGSGAGTAAGSVTSGNGAAAPPGTVGGFTAHVVLGGTGWRALMIAGAVLIAAAGIGVMVRAGQLPAMSARYDRHPRHWQPRLRGTVRAMTASTTSGSEATGSGATGSATIRRETTASMWETLSAGGDPTARPE
jgi:hypothetical protein